MGTKREESVFYFDKGRGQSKFCARLPCHVLIRASNKLCFLPHACGQRVLHERMSSLALRVQLDGIESSVQIVCRECLRACTSQVERNFLEDRAPVLEEGSSRQHISGYASIHVKMCLRGVHEAEYVKDIFEDLQAIVHRGEEGQWWYGPTSFMHVSIRRSKSPPTPTPYAPTQNQPMHDS